MTMTDDDLDTRLRAARVAGPPLPSGAVSLLVRETRDLVHRRRTRTAVGAGVVVAALGIGSVTAGPALADSVRNFLAQSGWTSSGTEVIKNSEWIDTAAPDLTEYVDSIFPADLPLAPGQTRSGVIAVVVGQQTPGLKQSIGLIRDIDRQVRLGWLGEWMDARASQDPARMDAAARVLVASTTWRGFVATDGGGVVLGDTAFMTAIAGGDADAAQAFAQFDSAEIWDGVDRTPLIDRILASAERDE